MNFVTRINLKTSGIDRQELINFCLNNENQYLAIGWSYIYNLNQNINNYEAFYYAVKDNVKRINPAFNIFWRVKEGDLFWTRDLEGNYWICRVIDKAEPKFDENMDIGAIIPVKAYKVGLEVPGQIKASFNRPRGGITQCIYDESIVEYSKYIYNQASGNNIYNYKKTTCELLDNLPDFDLEELVIAYLQIKENYYVLSNSIANKSTTIKIECELISRDKLNFRKAVLQVKGGKTKSINALDYKSYVDDGYIVYLYAPQINNIDKLENCIEITKKDLHSFYNDYKTNLPKSITKWENLFN